MIDNNIGNWRFYKSREKEGYNPDVFFCWKRGGVYTRIFLISKGFHRKEIHYFLLQYHFIPFTKNKKMIKVKTREFKFSGFDTDEYQELKKEITDKAKELMKGGLR